EPGVVEVGAGAQDEAPVPTRGAPGGVTAVVQRPLEDRGVRDPRAGEQLGDERVERRVHRGDDACARHLAFQDCVHVFDPIRRPAGRPPMHWLSHGPRRYGRQMISHDVSGSGPALLLLHAGVADSRMWEPQREALARTYRVIRCDLRGYGRTPLTTEPFDNAHDVRELLEHLGVDRTAVVAASAGGHVGLQVASAWPG